MAYRVGFTPAAQRELRALDGEIHRRVAAAIDAPADDPRPPGVKRMRGKAPDVWRIRVGDYRVPYRIRDDVLIGLVVKIGHRREVFRRR